MIEVMEHLQQYVAVKDSVPQECLVSGDGLSVERIIHAQRSRNNGETIEDRLGTLWAAPQEFHKEILLFQVNITMNVALNK